MHHIKVVFPVLLAALATGLLLAVLGTVARAEVPTITSTLILKGTSSQAAVKPIIDDFYSRTGISITYQTYSSYSELLNCKQLADCPDVALIPNPGLMVELAKSGSILPLDTIVTDFDTHYNAAWRNVGSVESDLYGIPFDASSKSVVWYRPQAFATISATVPVSWTQLLNLSNQLFSHGQTPFSIGAESGAASGWPLTDIFENILLRVGGPDAHHKLVHHQIAWTDPVVVETIQKFTDIVGQNDYQVGGITGTLTTNFIDAFTNVFNAPHQGTMYFGANWDINFINSGLTPLTDYDEFTFPEINPAYGKPIIGGGDLAILFNNSSQAESLIQYLASPEAGLVWVNNIGNISPNTGVNLTSYSNPIIRSIAGQVVGASNFSFDLDDQLPAELQKYFWDALMNFVAHQDQMLPILQGIETKANQLQGPVTAIYVPIVMRP